MLCTAAKYQQRLTSCRHATVRAHLTTWAAREADMERAPRRIASRCADALPQTCRDLEHVYMTRFRSCRDVLKLGIRRGHVAAEDNHLATLIKWRALMMPDRSRRRARRVRLLPFDDAPIRSAKGKKGEREQSALYWLAALLAGLRLRAATATVARAAKNED